MHTHSDATQGQPRPFCTRCLKAARACLCSHAKAFETGIQFVFLMHRKEQRDRLGTGTGRLSHLMLKGSRLMVGVDFDGNRDLQELLQDGRWFPCVLFPGSGSTDVSSPEGRQALSTATQGRTPLVFVIDASWFCARQIMRHNISLASLPRISFSTGRKSAYGFKRQPREECLSTLEAVHELLTLFEGIESWASQPQGAHNGLLAVFDRLVAFQKEFSPENNEDRQAPHLPSDAASREGDEAISE